MAWPVFLGQAPAQDDVLIRPIKGTKRTRPRYACVLTGVVEQQVLGVTAVLAADDPASGPTPKLAAVTRRAFQAGHRPALHTSPAAPLVRAVVPTSRRRAPAVLTTVIATATSRRAGAPTTPAAPVEQEPGLSPVGPFPRVALGPAPAFQALV